MSDDIYQRAMDEWGVHLQVDKASEECAELIQTLTRWHLGHDNDDDIAEEIADVEIMCEQLRLEFDSAKIDVYKEQKLNRLEKRIES